ncbi:MAG TPA: ABC transporter ATP-binding protein [Acidimicrobiales bacterium]|nr:ABC transporter ATP-binding protein [Acidimicrobiales bacterium]
MGVASLTKGFAEAGLLYLVVQAAMLVAAGQQTTELSLGPVVMEQAGRGLIFAACLVLVLVLFMLAVVTSAAAAALTTRTLSRARKRTFGAFVASSWRVKSEEPEGRLQTLLSGHVQRVGTGSLQVTNGITALLSFVAYMASAVLIDPLAAGVVVFGVTVVGLALLPLTRLSRRLSGEAMQLNNRYAGRIAEAVRLAKEVQVFDVGEDVSRRLATDADEAERFGFRSRLVTKLTPSVYQYSALLLVVCGLVIISSVGGGEVAQLGAVVVLLVRALSYGQQLSSTAQHLAETRPFLDELLRAQDRYHRHRLPRDGHRLRRMDTIALRRVRFAYQPGEPVLDDVTFTVAAGEAIGVVGPSGGGKSTLVQTLLRLRTPTEGAYEIDGRPAKDFALGDWYRHFAFVPQENLLLAASVRDNIRFFRAHLSDDDLEHGARLAHIHEDIVALPQGYETVIGPGARDLSGGQRQRLGLARALAGTPNVLVLDEPTSALDMRSEELMQHTLRDISGSLTLFIVAHRMSTLSICDRILVLERGRVVALGTHAELESANSFYQDALRLSRTAI